MCLYDKGMSKKIQIAQIFQENWNTFKVEVLPKYGPHRQEYIVTEVQKMMKCASGELGWAEYICENCTEKYRVNFSCKGKFCTRCGKTYTDNWVNRMEGHLLEVEHRHVVFTIPERLREPFWHCHEGVLKLMMDTSVKVLQEFVERYHGVKAGIVATIHTFGRDLKYNPHVHVLLTNGGVTKEGVWKKLKYIPYEKLRKKWQYALLTSLRKEFVGESRIEEAVEECFEKYRNGFYVRVEKPLKKAREVAKYVGRYLGRPAMAEGKLLGYDGKTVKFWYMDHKTKKRVEKELEVHEWMKRLVNHLMKPGFKKVRHYGGYSRRGKKLVREQLLGSQSFEQQKLKFVGKSKNSLRKNYIGGFEKRGENCGCCGQKTVLYKIWHPKYGVVYEYKEGLTEEVRVENSKKEKERAGCQLSLPDVSTKRADTSGSCTAF